MKQLGFAKDENTLPDSTINALLKRGFKIILLEFQDHRSEVKRMIIRSVFFDLLFDQEGQKMTQTVRRSITPDNMADYLTEIKNIPSVLRSLRKDFNFLMVASARNYLERKIVTDAGALIVKPSDKNPLKIWYTLLKKQILSNGIPFQIPSFDSIAPYDHIPDKSIKFFFKISFGNYTYHYNVLIGLDQIVPYSKSFNLKRIVKAEPTA